MASNPIPWAILDKALDAKQGPLLPIDRPFYQPGTEITPDIGPSTARSGTLTFLGYRVKMDDGRADDFLNCDAMKADITQSLNETIVNAMGAPKASAPRTWICQGCLRVLVTLYGTRPLRCICDGVSWGELLP